MNPNADPQAGEQSQATTESTPPQQNTSRTAEEYEAMLKELRTENAKHRTENRDLKAFKTQAEQATLTEVEKERQARAAAEERANTLQKHIANDTVKNAAKNLGIINPDLAIAAIQAQIEYDDAGMPKNADEVLRGLLKSNPYLANPVNGVSAANPGQSQTADNRRFKTSEIQKLDFWTKNKTAIEKAYKEGRVDND